MVNFNLEKYLAEGAVALEAREAIEKAVDAVVDRGYDNVVIIGVGGTWIEWSSVIEVVRRYTDLPIILENAAEFMIRGERKYLSKRSLVVTSSISGDTKEILQAVKLCTELGIEVVGFTKNTATPLGRLVDHFITLDSVECENSYIEYFLFLLYLLYKRGEYPQYPKLARQMTCVHKELVRIREDFDPRAKEIARRYHKAPYTIFTGSGPMWHCTYLFAMCLLEEMQWVRTRPVTSADFFHGTLELVEDGVPVFVVKGVDEYRPLDQRVEDFLSKYEVNDGYEVFDMAAYRINGVDEEFADITAILVFCATVLERLSKQYEQFTGHSLAFRRYYRQLDY